MNQPAKSAAQPLAPGSARGRGVVAAPVREFLAFRLGDEDYAIDILKVQEIRVFEAVTKLPGAPDAMVAASRLTPDTLSIMWPTASLSMGVTSSMPSANSPYPGSAPAGSTVTVHVPFVVPVNERYEFVVPRAASEVHPPPRFPPVEPLLMNSSFKGLP